MSECDVNSPIDLSRRSDSVETRKTPSPSSFTETSPSLENDSPLSMHFRKNSLLRSDTPTNRYHPSAFKPIKNTKQERITPSPTDSIRMHHQYKLLNDPNHTETNSYYLNALHPERKYSKATTESGPSSPDVEAPISLTYSKELSTQNRKSNRPFKIYSENPQNLTATILPSSMDKFHLFRQQALQQLYASGELTNPKKRPMSQKSYDDSEHSEIDYYAQNDGENKSDSSSSNGKGIVKDEAYYERRRKNNVAAKKSRDRRRLKESELVIRAAFLQRENYQLRCELDAVKRQLERFIAV